MISKRNEILVFRRDCFRGLDRFVAWSDDLPVIACVLSEFAWLPRAQAEKAKDWMQPAPCALIRDHAGRYAVSRRVKRTRADLRSRISLVIGGHVDLPFVLRPILKLLEAALRRELEEELGLTEFPQPKPIGLVIDSSSLRSSRHVAFVYEVVVDRPIVSRAPEEFSSRSKFSGRFFTPEELSKFHSHFDPWSLLLFEDYIWPSHPLKMGRQTELSTFVDD